MKDCLFVLFADIQITASNMNQISVNVDHVKLYFEIPDRFSQILHGLTILDIPMMVGIMKQTLRIGITYGLGGYNLSKDSNQGDDT
jgi:hypothetical protein